MHKYKGFFFFFEKQDLILSGEKKDGMIHNKDSPPMIP